MCSDEIRCQFLGVCHFCPVIFIIKRKYQSRLYILQEILTFCHATKFQSTDAKTSDVRRILLHWRLKDPLTTSGHYTLLVEYFGVAQVVVRHFGIFQIVVRHLGIFQVVVPVKLLTSLNIPSCCTTSWNIPSCCTSKTSWDIPSCCCAPRTSWDISNCFTTSWNITSGFTCKEYCKL